MKKFEDVGTTLLELGFENVNNEKYVNGNVTIYATEIVGHTVGSFLEKAHRRGWLVDGKVSNEMPMLLEPGSLLKNNHPPRSTLLGKAIRVFNAERNNPSGSVLFDFCIGANGNEKTIESKGLYFELVDKEILPTISRNLVGDNPTYNFREIFDKKIDELFDKAQASWWPFYTD